MTDNNRLDRLEILLEKIGQRVDSNAKAIEALTNDITDLKEEWSKDRKAMYQLLGRLARSQSDFYETQSDFYHRFDEIDKRQEDIVKILKQLKEQS